VLFPFTLRDLLVIMRGMPSRLGLRKLSFAATDMRYCGNIEVLSVRVIDFLDARARLDEVLDRVTEDADYAIISRYDAPDVVVMSLDTFNALMETLHLLKSPANAAHLFESIEQYRNGRLI
jgi:antitoxin YefM